MTNQPDRDLEALKAALPDYEIEPYADWKPGEPVKNTGDLLLKRQYEEEQLANLELPFGKHTIVCHDGVVKDLAYTAPEIIDWQATAELHEKCNGTY